MTIRNRIRDLIDRLHQPPDVVPVLMTWAEWWHSQVKRGTKASVCWLLKLLLWLFD